ncbi:MAG: hypothetical protein BWY32_01305 [bacterium ADurb.Bin243]|nr:MAG: hypothetical protein BWY32_01305 [bacterium ADurb.Bin243]
MKYIRFQLYMFIIAAALAAVLNNACHNDAFAQSLPQSKKTPSVSAEAGPAINAGAASETKAVDLKKQAAKKKKLSLKTTIYIFDTIVSALMHLLIGTGAFMIVLMILKWFFLERRVDQ